MDNLAIDGGKPVTSREAVKRWPVLDRTDREAVLRVLDRGIVAGSGAPETIP